MESFLHPYVGIKRIMLPYLGATSRLRPDDLIITNYLLYQLSYGGLLPFRVDFTAAGIIKDKK